MIQYINLSSPPKNRKQEAIWIHVLVKNKAENFYCHRTKNEMKLHKT